MRPMVTLPDVHAVTLVEAATLMNDALNQASSLEPGHTALLIELLAKVHNKTLTARVPFSLAPISTDEVLPFEMATRCHILLDDLKLILDEKHIKYHQDAAPKQLTSDVTKAASGTVGQHGQCTPVQAVPGIAVDAEPDSGPRLVRKSALVQELEPVWGTIGKDLDDMGRNGLRQAAYRERRGKHGRYDVQAAKNWAKENDRLTEVNVRSSSPWSKL